MNTLKSTLEQLKTNTDALLAVHAYRLSKKTIEQRHHYCNDIMNLPYEDVLKLIYEKVDLEFVGIEL